jgi:transposase
MLTRGRHQLTRDRVRLQNQIESLLEEGQIKLSSAISDLLGVSGYRILRALAKGESDLGKLADLADPHLQVSREHLMDALNGQLEALHRTLLDQDLDRLDLIDKQIKQVGKLIVAAEQEHQQVIVRLCGIPGLLADGAQQIVAELGPEAAAFPSAAQTASWVGICPGREESAGVSKSNRSPKGNRPMRRLLNQLAWAAVKTKESFFQHLFQRLVPKLGKKKAIWAVAHRLLKVIWKVLHEKVEYVERGPRILDAKARNKRKQKLVRELRKLGYTVEVATA